MLLISIYNDRTELTISNDFDTACAPTQLVRYAFKHLINCLNSDEFKILKEAINERRG